MIAHTCSCGRKYTAEQWKSLPFVGHMPNYDMTTLELRNCVCGSTRAIAVGAKNG